MTDIEKFKELYNSLGVEYQYDNETIYLGDYYHEDEVVTVAGDSVEGYSGFYTIIEFDKDGKFKSQGVYE